jgi:hypothetical protein
MAEGKHQEIKVQYTDLSARQNRYKRQQQSEKRSMVVLTVWIIAHSRPSAKNEGDGAGFLGKTQGHL